MKGQYVKGASLPKVGACATYGSSYRRFWGRSAAERFADQQLAAYVENVGHEPRNFTSGLACAQWEYGLQGTPYYTKNARQGVLLYTMEGGR